MSNESHLLGWRKRWNQRLLQFLGRRVRAVDIEDLAQETYLRLLRARDLSEVRNPQAYLLRVASHVVADWRDGALPTQPMSDEVGELLIDEDPPDLNLEASLSQQRLDRSLAEMTPMMRAVLLLRLREGYSYKAIAEKLEITLRQVRRYIARGCHTLREVLEE